MTNKKIQFPIDSSTCQGLYFFVELYVVLRRKLLVVDMPQRAGVLFELCSITRVLVTRVADGTLYDQKNIFQRVLAN